MLKNKELLQPIQQFLRCQTPEAWVEKALQEQEILLMDHAHCERKAASSALNLVFHYSQHVDLIQKMSKIVREEMRHFEQVLSIMKSRNITFKAIAPSRYAQGLRKHARNDAKSRLIDLLIIGAFVEARSCERFAAISPHLDVELAKFYMGLLSSEARHFQVYLGFAEKYADGPISDRIDFFADIENELLLSPDDLFRFHSGTPIN